ncbi:hypothetical protein M9435_005489 [Picochlorum sp. BPE23]|nr:hypothetical protein M9435_005489 [Picochlorum sp. BPE23]
MSFQSTFGASRTRLFLSKSVYGGSAGSISARIPAMNTKLHAIKDSMMEIYDAETLQTEDLAAVLARPRIDFTSILDTVSPIVDAVRTEGDSAVKAYTAKFDRVELNEACCPIEDLADPVLDPEVTKAFDVAYDNIRKFHEAQKTDGIEVETMEGVTCRRVSRPINSVGLYVPGGSAVLPSTALMLAVPASLAGCKTIVLATPPRSDGSITPEVLYCAKKAGVTHVLKAGGAQAVAALAWGTETCPKTDKIFGPGPSEVLVIADEKAPLSHVALDLLSQAEHGPDSQAILIALPGVDVEALRKEVEYQCSLLPRAEVTMTALSHSRILSVDSIEKAVEISNLYSPEHLIVNIENAERVLPMLDNAGSVFLGRWTPESVGDYASGTNHVLPTYGYARMYSGVSLDAFTKKMTVQSLTYQGLQNLGPHVAKMAEVEGLDAHRRAVTLRLGIE